jgi:hypothetical protein
MRSSFGGTESTEVKGSRLAEPDVAKVARLLRRFGVVGEVVAMDMGDLSQADVASFRERQAASIRARVDDRAPAWLHREASDLAELTLGLSDQNFVQGYLMVALIDKLLRVATAYHAQRGARELAEFQWVIDAKDKTLSAVERFWTELVFPALRAKSVRDPIGFIPWGDYSYFAPFEDEIAAASASEAGVFDRVINMGAVLKDRRFAKSDEHVGLQLADIFANAIARALNGRLRPDGWRPLGPLLIYRNPNGPEPGGIQMMRLRLNPHEPVRVREAVPYGSIVEELARLGTPMVPKWYAHHTS